MVGILGGWRRAEAKVLTFKIDGEIACWSDLTLRYLVRAIGCNVAAPDRQNGLISSRIDSWWGSAAATEENRKIWQFFNWPCTQLAKY